MTVFYIPHDIVRLIPQNSLQYDLQPIVSKVRAFRWMEEKLYYISLVSVNFFPVLMGICSLIPCFFPIFMGICIMISYDKFCKNFESKRRDEAMVYFNEGINFISNEHFFTTSKEVGMICRFLYHYRNRNYNDWYHDMWYNFVQKIHNSIWGLLYQCMFQVCSSRWRIG